jgi:arsenate reductase-like glutaredoxin family protein
MGVRPRDIIREKEKLYAELDLADADDGALLDAITAYPVLMNRPIVVTPNGAKLCRPPDLVKELL